MKYFRLGIKFLSLVLLVLSRMGEIDISPLWSHLRLRYHAVAQYYAETLLSLVIFLLLLDFVQFVIIWVYRKRKKVAHEDNFIIGIGQIYSIVFSTGIMGGLMSLFRLEIKEVFTSLSIIFAGLVLLTKDYVSNMINGMIITFSGQMSIGDNVKIGAHKGKIIDITLQNIHILNDDDDVIYFPNNMVLTVEVVNYTKRDIKRTSIDFDIDLRHLKNIEDLEQRLIEALSPYHDAISPDSYYLRVAEVRKDALSLKFQYILKEPNKELERQTRRRTIRSLVEIISDREKKVDNLPKI